MPVRNPSRVVSFDADHVREIIQNTLQGTLRSLVEYDASEVNPLYVDDVTLSFYEDAAHMEAHFETVHNHVQMDFLEQTLFTEDLFPVTERVRFQTTGFELFTLLRIYRGREGLFLALDPDEPITPLVDAVEDVLADTPPQTME